jgi:AAA15 family ATPase/GTPase
VPNSIPSERQHLERIPKIDKYCTRILPIAAIYGGNASGKTNFLKHFISLKLWLLEERNLKVSFQ